ncbi:MAG: hypothetical protein U0X75_23585 [Acidobacteriota bacterium]
MRKPLIQDSAVKTAFLWTLAMRLFYSTIGALAAPYLKLDPALIRSNDLTDNLLTRDTGWTYRWLGVWERFDTLWYLHIAAHGYDRPDAVVFFPFYPLLIKLLGWPLRSPLLAALLISTVASFFLLWGLQKLLSLDLPSETVRRTILLLLLWPSSFILFVGYPEALLLAFLIWAVYCARQQRWWWAGVLGLLAGLTKAAGLCVIVPLAVLAWRKREWRAWPISVSLLSPLLVTALIKVSGLPLASDAYPKHWRTEIAFPLVTLWASLHEVITQHDAVLLLNLVALTVVFGAAFLKRLNWEYTLFALATLTLFLTKKTDPLLQSTNRYVLTVFPAFASLAIWLRHPLALALYLFLALLLNLALLWSFFEWALVV